MPEQIYVRHVIVTMKDGTKFEVETNAFDQIGVNMSADIIDLTVIPVYKALIRCEIPGVPTSRRAFLERLLAIEDLPVYLDGEPTDTDPTRPAVSGG